jgi:hypothetical protein
MVYLFYAYPIPVTYLYIGLTCQRQHGRVLFLQTLLKIGRLSKNAGCHIKMTSFLQK